MTSTSRIRKLNAGPAESHHQQVRIVALLEDAGRSAGEAATAAVRASRAASKTPRVFVHVA